MIMTTPPKLPMHRGADIVLALLLLGAVACGRGGATPATKASPAAGPVTIDVVRVVEQPLNVQLSLPGELTPYQSVAIYPRVTGFVKTVRVDRGSRVQGRGPDCDTRGAGAPGSTIRSAIETPGGRSTAGGGSVQGGCRSKHLRQAEGRVRHTGRGRGKRRAHR